MAWLAGPVADAERLFAPWEAAGWMLELDSVLRRPMDGAGSRVVRALARRGEKAVVLAWNSELQYAQVFRASMPYDDEAGLTSEDTSLEYVYVPGAVVTDVLLEYFGRAGMKGD